MLSQLGSISQSFPIDHCRCSLRTRSSGGCRCVIVALSWETITSETTAEPTMHKDSRIQIYLFATINTLSYAVNEQVVG